MNKQLFILPPGLYRGANAEEIEATANGLAEMDLFHLPYERDVYVQMAWSDCISHQGKLVEFSPHIFAVVGPLGKGQVADVVLINTKSLARASLINDPLDVVGEANAVIKQVTALLIVMLATRNVVKTTKQNKLAKLGIGKKNWRSQFAYTTTISLPADLDDDPDRPPTGTTKAPHLRRGHIRRQHFGPDNQYEKKIWVASVFVNADPNFVNKRGAYNIVT